MLEMGNLNLIDSEDEDDGTMITENPLHNELVLDVIFDNLPKEDWKSARLVNKIWHSVLQWRWRDQKVYFLDCPQITAEDTAKLLELQHPENNPNDPLELHCYPIRNMYFNWDYSIRHVPDQTRFWEMYGHGLKTICFNSIAISDEALFKRLLLELTPNLENFCYCYCEYENMGAEVNTSKEYTPSDKLQKNLKVLEVDTSSPTAMQEWNDFDYPRRFPISWLELFSVFPNIQNLTVQVDPQETEGQSDLSKLFEAIDIIRKANNNEVLNITELHTIQPEFASAVVKNQSLFSSLPISTLRANVTAVSHAKIVILVQTFQLTLHDLTLKRDYPGILIRNDFLPNDFLPQNLTKLSLEGKFFSSWQFLSNTPNLEELRMKDDITYMLQPAVCVGLAAISPLVNLKKFEYTLDDLVSLENMLILAKLTPNVKTCVCTVEDDGFQALCHGWANLERLDLSFDFDSEDFFVEHLIRLTNLRSLKLNGYSNPELRDKSVFEGFLKLPFLVQIKLPTRVSITEEGFQALEGKLRENLWIW